MAWSYDHDLDNVAKPFRSQVWLWWERGVPVSDACLYALLSGDWPRAIELANGRDLVGLVRFLQKHVSPRAWGDPYRVAQWEFQGGRECEPKRRRA